MTDMTDTQTLEQTLNKTDLGHVVYENRKIFFALVLGVLVAATGYVLFMQTKKSKALDHSEKVFEFQSKTWAEAKAGKIPAPELVKSFESLDTSIQSAPIMLPVVLEMTKFLAEKGSYVEADAILSKVAGTTKHPIASFFVGMQRAVVLEKLGKTDEAISNLEKMVQSKDALMPARISLELGRLYLVKGEKGKAQSQFEHVIANYPNDEQAKLAKLYLSQMAK